MFLMADERSGRIGAYEADPRAIVPLRAEEGLRLSRTLMQRVRSGRFRITTDRCFSRVIGACAEERSEGTWISPPLAALYIALHESGEAQGVHAHSVEAWLDDSAGDDAEGKGSPLLVGGLYGVAVGAVFCGESMFSRPALGGTDASKVCLVHLIRHLNARGFELLDSQIWNPHLARFGAFEIPATEYRERVEALRDRVVGWLPFEQGL